MDAGCVEQLTFWDIGKQQVTATFDGGHIVTDAGLLALREFEKGLGILAEVAERLPDPRSQKFVIHSREAILTQQVYQILAAYADGNDAQVLRGDPLFQTLVDRSPRDEQPLASGSTLNRFHQAFTRRQAELPREERPVLLEMDAALFSQSVRFRPSRRHSIPLRKTIRRSVMETSSYPNNGGCSARWRPSMASSYSGCQPR